DRRRDHDGEPARLRRQRAQDDAGRPARRQRSVAWRHARVVHDLAAAAAQLRPGSLRDERAAAARPAAPARGDARGPGVGPGPWLRLTALAASAATLLAVVSGAAHLGTAHRVLAALAGPPLVALLAAAWIAHRQLLRPVLVAGLAFAAAAFVTPHDLHVAFASLAFAAALVAAASTFRDRSRDLDRGRSRDMARDYVALTKPRIMSLLLLTGFCGMIVGARGWPGTGLAAAAMAGLAPACGGASALNHVL